MEFAVEPRGCSGSVLRGAWGNARGQRASRRRCRHRDPQSVDLTIRKGEVHAIMGRTARARARSPRCSRASGVHVLAGTATYEARICSP